MRDKEYVDNRYDVDKYTSKQRGNKMELAFIEQVELLCDLHIQQTSESEKDNCVLMILIMAKNARQEFIENLVHAEVANDAQVTSR